MFPAVENLSLWISGGSSFSFIDRYIFSASGRLSFGFSYTLSSQFSFYPILPSPE
jgi:hypothetical protein